MTKQKQQEADTAVGHGGTQSVAALARTQPKFILEIHRTENKFAIDPIDIANGDYITRIARGRRVVVPKCVIEVLKDAVSERIDPRTLARTKFHNYPYTAVPYDGPLPIGTEVDELGEEIAAPVSAAA